MNDQAERLRNLLRNTQTTTTKNTRIITVTSGKGGVGKSNFTLNFALALQSLGYKVVIFDADIGMANLDVLMGISSKYNLYHLLRREKTIWEIMQQGAGQLEFIAGGSGFNELLNLSAADLQHFIKQVEQLNGYADFIIFDTGAGLSQETLQFIVAAHEVIVVTTPEPTAITDAYALIKMVHKYGHSVQYNLVVNRVADHQEGTYAADKMKMVAKRFLNLDLVLLGFVSDDAHVSQAVKRQVPLLSAYPYSSAAQSFNRLAQQYGMRNDKNREEREQEGGIKRFFHKMLQLLK